MTFEYIMKKDSELSEEELLEISKFIEKLPSFNRLEEKRFLEENERGYILALPETVKMAELEKGFFDYDVRIFLNKKRIYLDIVGLKDVGEDIISFWNFLKSLGEFKIYDEGDEEGEDELTIMDMMNLE